MKEGVIHIFNLMFLLFFLSFMKEISSFNSKKEECEVCKKNFQELFQNPKENSINYISDFQKICGNNKKCQKVFRIVQNSLLDKTFKANPNQFCSIIGKCRPKMESLSIEQRPNHESTTQGQKYRAQLHSDDNNDPDGNCAYCKSIFDYLTGEALQDTTVPVFMKLVKTMCDNLPPASAICEQVTNHHVEKLIMLVTSKFENQELCQSAGLCQPKE